MRRIILPLFTAALLASPALASTQDKPDEPARPLADRPVTAGDVVATPVTDLNLKKDDIPPLLLAAQEKPYDLAGMGRCSQIAGAIGDLDAVLGEDIDVAQARDQQISAGRIAQSAVGSFIPFRGIIREISGANAQERKLQAAVYAGSVRRAFLKGVGQQRGCHYPARAATAAVIAQREAAAQAAAQPHEPAPRATRRTKTRFVSKPVVQKSNSQP
ncbi:MAG: hypothetical protein KGL44_04100 [Sphingomonadales bacterium]|nr:hypothetical protein [Sphingomonadales bacterium]